MNPSVDATDLYMFRSYEAGRAAYVTILANYIPFQDPQGGPNFYMFNPNALYEIHIDNTGAGSEAMTFQFRFTNKSSAAALTVGGKAVKIPLIAAGPISGTKPATLNVNEAYTLNIVRGDRRTGTGASVVNAAGDCTDFLIDQGRPSEALQVLKDETRTDAVLLRLAVAGTPASAPTATCDVAEMRDRIALASLRPDASKFHGCEQAMFALAIGRAPTRALEPARGNVEPQRDANDVLVLAEAARERRRACDRRGKASESDARTA